MADSIREMPMGMNTIVQEGSGGQRQRLMIARAVAPKPKVLFLDEATSALDNITQKKVAEALDKMKCTRIVIAHRLSTIRRCDRIILLKDGKLAEDGTYDIMGDNCTAGETVPREKIFGILTQVKRGKRLINTTDRFYKLYVALVPVRRFFIPPARLARRVLAKMYRTVFPRKDKQ